MKKLGFEHQGASTYLAYELGPEDNVDSMSLGMLMNNRIPGFAPVMFTQMDNIMQVKYNVTARVPADQYLLGVVNKKRLLGVFRGIAQAFLSAEDYMIDAETVQLEAGSIFSDVATGETVLICVPVTGGEGQKSPDLRAFLKEILFSAQYDEHEDRDYVAKIMSYLNGSPVFSAREFKELLDYVDMAPVQPVRPERGPAAAKPQERPVSYQNEQPSPAPGPKPDGVPVPPAAPPAGGGEEAAQEPQNPISLFYLLQHYNKENAAMYKAQKEMKKAAKKGETEKKKTVKQKAAPQSFAVPGQDPGAPAAKDAPPVQQSFQQPQPAPPVQQSFQQPQPAPPVQQSFQQPPFLQTVPPAPPLEPAAGKEDTIYFGGEDDATVLMGQEPQAARLIPYLIRKKNQEKIPLGKAVFRLGRDRDYNDYSIADNRYIGHSHCHIICRDGEYFVVDDNSKNYTKVNGSIIPPGAEVKISHGSLICLADEEFEFKLY